MSFPIDLLPRILAAAIGAALLVWSVFEIQRDIRVTPYARAATRIEGNEKFSKEVLLRLGAGADALLAGSACDSRTLRTAVTLDLAALDVMTTDNDILTLDQRQAAAVDATRAAVRCIPMDGNLWLRAAMLEAATVGKSDKLIGMLRASYRTAPNEAWIIQKRLNFVGRLFAAGVTEIQSEYETDIRKLLSRGEIFDAAHAFVEVSKAGIPLYQAAFDRLPAERREALAKAIKRLQQPPG